MLKLQHTQNAPKIILKDTGTDTKDSFVMICHKKRSREIAKCIVYLYVDRVQSNNMTRGCKMIPCEKKKNKKYRITFFHKALCFRERQI